MAESAITIPEEVFRIADESHRFFSKISSNMPEMQTRDILDIDRAMIHAEIMQRYASLKGARLLEIGSGYGVNLAVWMNAYGVDGYGIEPSSPEWGPSLEASRILLAANHIDPDRIVNAFGENLPFTDKSFDIVYSANVLEHVQEPEVVLKEAIRVLKPGGILHCEVPNFMSYYESHYAFLQPPVFNRAMLELYVKLRGRNPAFAKTINTINPIWCRRVVRRLQKDYRVSLVSLGEDVFLERLSQPWQFQTEQGKDNSSKVVSAIQKVNWRNWIGRLIVLAQGHYPLYFTVRREA